MKKKLNIQKFTIESFVTEKKAEINTIKGGMSAGCVSFLYNTACNCRPH